MSITISQKHGVNPSLLQCPCCGKDIGVALCGRLPHDQEAPRHMRDRKPCEACHKEFEGYKARGFVCYILQDHAEQHRDTSHAIPWLFYIGLTVITHEAAARIFSTLDRSKGCICIEQSLAKQIGLV